MIADEVGYHDRTVFAIRRRFAVKGFNSTIYGEKRSPRSKVLDGEQEAKIIAMRLGKPRDGYVNWTLRLVAERGGELGIVESVRYQMVRNVLKNQDLRREKSSIG